MAIGAALSRVREAPFVLDALAAADELASVAGRDGRDGYGVGELREAVFDPSDQLTAVAAVHALGRVFDDEADSLLSDLLSSEHAFIREHAAWAIGSRLPRLDAIGRLVGVVIAGGFPGMVAQRTLERWARPASDHVALALEGALAVGHDASTRARLVETLGLVPGPLAARVLLHLASDADEPTGVRVAAVAALGDRSADGPMARVLLSHLADDDDDGDELGAAARLALFDLGMVEPTRGRGEDRAAGLTIAQLFLHADLDRHLTQAGAGDNGGIATLLVRLGDALVGDDSVGRVITMSRGSSIDAVRHLRQHGDPSLEEAEQHLLVPVPLPHRSGSIATVANGWTMRVAAERGIRRVLGQQAPVDIVHLRMADVGSLAGHTVARQLGIPTVFSLAPDPHGVIHALDMTGALSRDNFGDIDAREHYWFRTRLVQRFAATAEHSVLFPRPNLQAELHELLGIDVGAEPQRYTVVPEGIDISLADTARREIAAMNSGTVSDQGDLAGLADLIAALPADRHGLALAISVGRLHRVKGMATVVEAWAGEPELRRRCNLVIVGGDLDDPSIDEQGQLDRIAEVLRTHPEAADGLVLAGHRPNGVVARWLAAASLGHGYLIGPHGAYVCGSLKEEFGLALLEALAAGLVVVAPAGGGPATFVRPGDTGVLVDTRSPHEVSAGLHAALDMAGTHGRSDRSIETVRSRFTVQAMAATLAGVYVSAGIRADR